MQDNANLEDSQEDKVDGKKKEELALVKAN